MYTFIRWNVKRLIDVLVKIEIIALIIIATLSFVTGIVLNILDFYRGKNIKNSPNRDINGGFEEKIDALLDEKRIKKDATLYGTTILSINIPKIKEIEETDIPVLYKNIDETPVIIETINDDDEVETL